MGHTIRCEKAVTPNCTCTGCCGARHGIASGLVSARALVAAAQPSEGNAATPQDIERACDHFRAKANALGKRVDARLFEWLVDNPDVLLALANQAIDAAKKATATLPGADQARLGLRSPQHLICEVLAQVAVALDQAIAAGKTLVDDVIPDGWGGYNPVVVNALRAILKRLVSKAVDLAMEWSGLNVALKMARIGAVTFCPDIDKHPAVKACGAPLVEEPMADGIAASLRDLAVGLAR